MKMAEWTDALSVSVVDGSWMVRMSIFRLRR